MTTNHLLLSICICCFFLGVDSFYAQVGIGTTEPRSEALLEIESEDGDKGILIPRVNIQDLTTLDPITSDNGTAAESLLVYNTNASTGKGFFYWGGSSWISMNGNNIGDVKHSFHNSDHDGWYKLNGRNISELPPTAATAASTLGFSTSLPDASDRVLRASNGSEAVGTITGSNTISINQANLPNYVLTGTTTNDGSHSHNGSTNTSGQHTHNYTDVGSGSASEAGSNSSVGPFYDDEDISDSTTDPAGNHTHTFTTDDSGNHSHNVTVNSGGSGTPINNTPASLVTNVFIYLGN